MGSPKSPANTGPGVRFRALACGEPAADTAPPDFSGIQSGAIMTIIKLGAFAGAFFVAAVGLSTSATATPLGGAARDLGTVTGEGSLLIEVQGSGNKGKHKGGGSGGGGGKSGSSSGGGNKQWSGNNSGGGNRSGGGGGGSNSSRNAAAIAVGVGLLGGLIAADQNRRAVETEERHYQHRSRCQYGSYINRYGERRCRR
jgi:hypothetical protein